MNSCSLLKPKSILFDIILFQILLMENGSILQLSKILLFKIWHPVNIKFLLDSPILSKKIKPFKDILHYEKDEDFEKFNLSDIKFLAVQLGKISVFEIKNIKRRMEFFKLKLSGIIVIKVK